MAHQLPAERRAQQHLGVSRQLRDLPAAAGLDDGQRRPGPFDLTGGGGQQRAGGDRVGTEHRGDLVGREVVAHRELQRLPLLGRGAGGLRPGQRGEFTPAALGLAGRAGARFPGGRRGAFGEPAQTGPAGEGVEPGAVQRRVAGAAAAVPLGERERLAEHRGRGVVFAQHGQAVGEQPVQMGLVAVPAPVRGARGVRAGPLGRLGPVPAPRVAARPVCAGGVRGVLGPAAHHPGDGRRMMQPCLLALDTFNPYG
ncbi:hypothetical protein Srufu_033860 [Streptomyces libani subsp. rufus]|nr:hypothetical protein Srufu_033860 [Streptomyces libani subsp. rufus]